MLPKKLYILVTVLSFSSAQAQLHAGDSLQENRTQKGLSEKSVRSAAITSGILVGSGLVALIDNPIFSDRVFTDGRNRLFPGFQNRADDFMALAPIGVVYGLNFVGVEGRHNFGNRTLLLAKAEILTMALTYGLKYGVGRMRPDESEANSFPSGHTSQAFLAATFLHREYGHLSPWYAIAGYANASAVGAFRVLNNRHYLSDVLVGAGIGVFSTNLVYLTHQYRWFNDNEELTLVPSYSQGTYGVFLSWRF